MSKNSIYFLVFTFVNAFLFSFGQVNPINNSVFLQTEVASVKVILSQEDLNFILDEANENSDLEFPATFIYQSSSLDDTILNVGFRLRGNTSRSALKKSFKISFNYAVQGQKYKGLEKMNLNGEHNDVSIMRTKISNEILTNLELFAPRSSYVKLYINDEYKGLYLNLEHLDDEFIQKRFPSDDSGNLYKCNWGANLTYLGTNPASYHAVYELKTNESVNDYSGLIYFLAVLNNTSSSQFPCAIESVFDVDSYLKTAAFEILIGHWDGYIFNNNNFYFYQKPSDGRFVFLEYDVDNTFGIDWFNMNWSTRNINAWPPNQERPLFNRLMSVPFYKNLFNTYLQEIVNTEFNSSNLLPRLNEIQNLIEQTALSDTYKSLDYGFTNDDFLAAITDAWGNHIPISFEDYIEQRATSALNQVVFQSATDPCLALISELDLTQENKSLIKVVDVLGNEVNENLKNELKFMIYSDGSVIKTIDFE